MYFCKCTLSGDSACTTATRRRKRAFLSALRGIENIPGKRPEIFFSCCISLFLALFPRFHEPWFDEAQAWQIAKCASLKDILFTIPHYEGHTPLWHLILCCRPNLGAVRAEHQSRQHSDQRSRLRNSDLSLAFPRVVSCLCRLRTFCFINTA